MWFKNLKIYRLINWDLDIDALDEQLSKHVLSEIAGTESEIRGWVPPKASDNKLTYSSSKNILIAFGVTKKILPVSVISQYVKLKVKDIEETQSYKPGRKEMKEIKEAVTLELLPRAFSLSRKVLIWVDLNNKLLVVDTASQTVADEVVALLHRSLEKIELKMYTTKISPKILMNRWFVNEELPTIFSIDDECELKAIGEDKSSIKYSKHALDNKDIVSQIMSGKEVVKLALTWRDKVSFVLQDNLSLKKIKPLDILIEDNESDEDAFDSDFRLMRGELSELILDLNQVFNE
jgi:recombination associated protein RdgC